MKVNKFQLIIGLILICICMAEIIGYAKADVILSYPASGVYDNEVISFRVQANGNYTTPQLIFSGWPGQPEDLYSFAGQYISGEKDLSTWSEGTYIVAGRAYNTDTSVWDWSNNLTMEVRHDIENKPALKVVGISPGIVIDTNKTKLVSVVDNITGFPVEGATIYIMEDAENLCNSYTTTISGKAKIEWVDVDDNILQNDIYFVRIEKQGYDVLEYDIEIDIEQEIQTKPELSIWGLDRQYNADISSVEMVRIKGSDTNKYLEDVVVKIVSAKGVPVSETMVSNQYGTIEYSISGIAQGEYSVVFEHPDYDTKIVDIEISRTPTPEPSPTPTPKPFFEWNGKQIYTPYTVTLSDGTQKTYTTAIEFSRDFEYVNGETVEKAKSEIAVQDPVVPEQETKASMNPFVLVAVLIVVVGIGALKLFPEMFQKRGKEEFEPESIDSPNMDFSDSVQYTPVKPGTTRKPK